jgi:hypothetical protein
MQKIAGDMRPGEIIEADYAEFEDFDGEE